MTKSISLPLQFADEAPFVQKVSSTALLSIPNSRGHDSVEALQ